MPTSLVDLAMRFLPADVIAKIAASLETVPATVAKGAGTMIPGAFKGIGTLAGNLDGAHQVVDVLSDYDLSELGELTGNIGEPDQDDALAQGSKLSRHLMNASDRDALIAATTASSGLDAAQSEMLLSLLTPIVAGTLVQQRLENNLDTAGLARLVTSDPTAPLSLAEPPAPPTPLRPTFGQPGTLQSAIANLKPASGTAASEFPSVSPSPTRAIPEVAKIQERPAAASRPRPVPAKSIPDGHTAPPRRDTRNDADDGTPTAPQRPQATSLTKFEMEDFDVDTAPVRRPGHYLARFGWLVPLLLLAVAGSWWLKTLFDEPDDVALAQPPQATAAAAPAVRDATPIPKITANAERPPSLPEAASVPRPEVIPVIPRPAPENPMTEAAPAPSPQVAAAETPSTSAAAAARDAEIARKADAAAAAERTAREVELARKAAVEAAAAKQARDTELARRAAAADAEAEARRQALARENAVAKATVARRLPASARATPRPTSVPPVTWAACQRNVSELSSANRIRFEFASPRITRASASALSALVVAIKSCPPCRIRIEGHTDTDGHFDRNQRLSENRARAVASYLVKAGVEAKRITSAGYGQTRPRVSNTSEANKQLNRRIEVSVEAG